MSLIEIVMSLVFNLSCVKLKDFLM